MTPQHVTGTIYILDQRINIRRFMYTTSYTKRPHVLKTIFNNGHFSKTIFTFLDQQLLLFTLIYYTNSKRFLTLSVHFFTSWSP